MTTAHGPCIFFCAPSSRTRPPSAQRAHPGCGPEHQRDVAMGTRLTFEGTCAARRSARRPACPLDSAAHLQAARKRRSQWLLEHTTQAMRQRGTRRCAGRQRAGPKRWRAQTEETHRPGRYSTSCTAPPSASLSAVSRSGAQRNTTTNISHLCEIWIGTAWSLRAEASPFFHHLFALDVLR